MKGRTLPAGRLPRQEETAYLQVMMKEVTPEDWGKITRRALEDALTHENPHVRLRIIQWLAKYLIGEPSQLIDILYQEETKFEIHVTFGEKEEVPQLESGEIVEGIIVKPVEEVFGEDD